MAWTVPKTLDTGDTWTSADWNTYGRDNLLETLPATLTAALQYGVADGNHNLVARAAGSATVATSQTSTSTSYTNLTTVGPEVTATTGTRAFVMFSANMTNSGAGTASYISCAVSGATTISASDDWHAFTAGAIANNTNRFGGFKLFDTLTAGSNTFTMKYKVFASTGTWLDRHIIVVPF